MRPNDAWKCLDWVYCCEQAPIVQELLKRWMLDCDHFQPARELYFDEYERCRLEPGVQSWWDGLTRDQQITLLFERMSKQYNAAFATSAALHKLRDLDGCPQ